MASDNCEHAEECYMGPGAFGCFLSALTWLIASLTLLCLAPRPHLSSEHPLPSTSSQPSNNDEGQDLFNRTGGEVL